jgi:hypothetical protein
MIGKLFFANVDRRAVRAGGLGGGGEKSPTARDVFVSCPVFTPASRPFPSGQPLSTGLWLPQDRLRGDPETIYPSSRRCAKKKSPLAAWRFNPAASSVVRLGPRAANAPNIPGQGGSIPRPFFVLSFGTRQTSSPLRRDFISPRRISLPAQRTLNPAWRAYITSRRTFRPSWRASIPSRRTLLPSRRAS